MFKEEIRSTALTTKAADASFAHKIIAPVFRGDVSMRAIARALFNERIEEGDTIRIYGPESAYNNNNVAASAVQYLGRLQPGQIRIMNVSVRRDESGTWKHSVKTNIPEGFYPMEDLEKWFEAAKIQMLILTDKPHDPAVPKSPVDNTRTLVIMENMNIMRWHLIASLMPRMLGKWFMDKPRTEFEVKNILCGIVAEKPDGFLAAIEKYAEDIDFRSMAIRQQLANFESRFEKEKIDMLEERSRSIEGEIRSLSGRLGALLANKEEILAQLFGYQILGKKSEPLTMNYFLANKNLVLNDVGSSYIDFYDSAWLSNWDPEKASATFAHDHCSSWLEKNEAHGISNEDAKRLYKAIFLTEEVRVRLWSHFRLYTRGEDILYVCDYDEDPDGCPDIKNALPNPHHYYHSCPGTNRQYVNECMMNGDIVGAIEQCISATAGINLTEAVSYRRFAEDLFDPKFGKVVYVKEKDEFMTTADAINWLKEKDEQEKKETAKEVAKEEEHV